MNSNIFEKKKNKTLNLFKEKKYNDVLDSGEKLLKKKPNDTQLIYLLGLTSIYLERFLDAEKYFKNLLSLKKNHELYYTYGNVLKKLEKYSEAVISFELAIKLNPNFSEAYNNLGNTKKLQDKSDEAIECFKNAIRLKENNIEALFNLSSIYKENNKFKELIEIYKKILSLNKNHLKTLYNLGTAYLFMGDILKGKKYFIKILEIDKTNISSFRNYVNITKIDKNDKIFNNFIKINFENLNDTNKIIIFDALSKCYFDQDNSQLAFEYLNKSNSIKKQKTKFSLSYQKKLFSNIESFFSDRSDFNLKFNDKLESKPLFIIGMPRSGTSLLEQILSTHTQIYGAGELYYLEKIIHQLTLEKPNDIEKYFKEIRNYYFKYLSKISDKRFIIDKAPLNFRWIGFILNALPEAKIIHIERNPMAVCWSNYKTLFVDSGLDFNLNQEDMANYYNLYNCLMKFWFSKFKNRIININYEEFVLDYESNSKKILSLLNLNWEDQLKNYEKTNRVVRTASFQQVRGKIIKNTSKQWEKYKDYLEPMQKILTNYQIKF